jgi:hypothetical protein
MYYKPSPVTLDLNLTALFYFNVTSECIHLYRNYSIDIVFCVRFVNMYVPYLFNDKKIYYTLSNNDVANYFLRKVLDDMKMSLSTLLTWFYKSWHVISTGPIRDSFWSDSYF